MRRFAAIVPLSAALVLVFGNAGSAQQVRSERLLGGNENPPVVSDGSGRFRAVLEDEGIAFRLRYDLPNEVLQAHLHIANPGNNGGIVVFLCSNLGNTPDQATERDCPESPGTVRGDIVAEDVQAVTEGDPPVEILEAGDLDGLKLLLQQGSVYANVHTDEHGAGEIRGQTTPRER